MKKSFLFLTFAVITAFSLFSLTSCGSDDDDVVNPITGNRMDNGHEYVDLGLPSGLKWATCNVGADEPEDYGSYFAWGETKPKTDYSYDTYKWWGPGVNQFTKYCTQDNKTTLDLVDDAARANWGGHWRMPTKADFEELKNNTTSEWVNNYNGVAGRFFYAANGNYIFFPAAGTRVGTSLNHAGSQGFYWSNSLTVIGSSNAYSFSGDVHASYRDYGHSVRPVRP